MVMEQVDHSIKAKPVAVLRSLLAREGMRGLLRGAVARVLW